MYRMVTERFGNLGSEKVHYKLVSERGFDTEPRWASGAVFGLRMRGEIESGGPISDPGLLRSVKEILDEFLSSGGLAVL
jgi:hypothetical protein